MFARERLRKSGTADFSLRDGGSGNGTRNSDDPAPFGITRRAVLGGAAAGAVATAAHLAGLFDPAPLEIAKTRRGLEVRTGRHVWSLARDRFGERSQFVRPPDPAQTGFGVRGARFPGTNIAFDLDFQFEMARFTCAGGWRMILRGNGMPANTSVAFVPWLQGEVAAATAIDSLATASLISRLTRGEASATAAARLAFAPDLTWRVDAELPAFAVAARSLRARAVVVAAATEGTGLFNWVLDTAPAAGSTNLLFRDIEPAARVIAFGRDDRQSELTLVPESVRNLGIQTFDTNLPMVVTGASGAFRADIEQSGVTLGGIETGEGLVLLGRHGSKLFHSASLPIAEKPHLVVGENCALTLHGEDSGHRLEVDARDGRLESFVARGALTNLAAGVEGADYVRLDFSDTEAWLKLGDIPAASEPTVKLDLVSELPVVLAQATGGDGVAPSVAPRAKAAVRARLPKRTKTPAPAQQAKTPGPAKPTPAEATVGQSLRSGIAVFNLSGPGGYELSLDGAKLRLVRGEDLLSLIFRFRGLTLVGVPGHLPYIADEQTSYTCKAKPRTPLLIVEFPPQHVAEEAFFRLVETEPDDSDDSGEIDFKKLTSKTNYPDVPLDITNVPAADRTPDKLEEKKEKLNPDYKNFRDAYKKYAECVGLSGNDSIYFGGKTPNPAAAQSIQDLQKKALAGLLAGRKCDAPKQKADSPFNEPLKPIARARLSGPSRLVFRLPCRDGHGTQRKVLDFTAAALTDWSQFDLSVVRRAERLFKAQPLNGLPEPETDFATILKHQFIFPNQAWTQRRQTIMDESGKKPADTETAIELPFRLLLSPDQTARFRTPDLRVATKDPRPIALWRAELDETQYGAGTRAIWSPDYHAGHFAKDGIVPERGPIAPWYPADKPPLPFRASLASYDRHELVALTSVHGMPVLARKPDSDAAPAGSGDVKRPRPSNFEPPPDFAITDPLFLEPEGIYVPPPLDVNEMTLTALGGSLDLDTRFEPPASPYFKNKDNKSENLFNAFSIERWKHRTTLGRDVAVEVVYKGFLYPLGNRASLVKVTERKFLANPHGRFPSAYLIQRMFIRVGKPLKKYPGIGHPFESRDYPMNQSLVLTKRTPDILDPTTPDGDDYKVDGKVAANVYGRLKLKYKDDGGNDRDIDGLSFWPRTKPELGGEVRFKIQIDGSDAAMIVPLLFVDNTAVHSPDTMNVIAAHYDSLRSAKNNDGTDNNGVRELCTARHSGAKRRYAPEKKTGQATFETDVWRLGVRGRLVEGSGGQQDFTMDAAMEGQDQPPFYPYVAEAAVKLRQVDNFTGNGSSWVRTGFAGIYVQHGLGPNENPAQLYLQLIDQVSLDVSKSGDRAGGVAKPNGMVLGLSTHRGVITGRGTDPASTTTSRALIAGTTTPAVTAGLPPHPGLAGAQAGQFDPSEFFGGALSEAKLLGLLPLKDVIRIVAIAGAPLLKEAVSYAMNGTIDEMRGPIKEIANGLNDLITGFRTEVDRRLAALPENLGATLAQLYPDLARALDEFQASLGSRDLDSTDPPTFMTAVSAIVESGQRAIAALDRVAADPTPLFVKDAIKLFADVNNTLRGLATAIGNQIVDGVRAAAAQQLKDFFCKPDAPMFGIAVFGPALDTACRDLDPSRPDAIANFVTDFRDAAQAEVEDIGHSLDDIRDQYQQLIWVAGTAADKDRLKAELADKLAKAQAEYQSTVLRIGEAMFFDAVGRPLLLLLIEMQAFVSGLSGDAVAAGNKLLSLVGRLFDAADALARAPAIQKALGDVVNACNETADFLKAAIDAIGLPKPDNVQSAAKSLQDGFAKLADLETKLRHDISTLPDAQRQQAGAVLDAVSRVRTGCAAGAERLAKTLIDALDARQRARDAVGNLCNIAEAGKQTLSFTATQQLFALRLRAIGEIQDLFARLGAALDPSPAPPSGPLPLDAGASPPSYVDDLHDSVKEVGTALFGLLNELAGLAGRIEDGNADQDVDRAALLKAMLDQAQKIATDVGASAARVKDDIEARKKRITDDGKALGKDWANLAKSWPAHPTTSDVAKQVRQLGDIAVRTGLLTRDQERGLVAAAASAITIQGLDIATVEGAIGKLLTPALQVVINIHTIAETGLQTIYDKLSDPATLDSFRNPLALFLGFDTNKIRTLFDPQPVVDDHAKLDKALKQIQSRPPQLQDAITTLQDLRKQWDAAGGPAIIRVGRNVEAAANKLLHGKLSDIIDTAAIRRRIEDELLQLIPVQYDLTYDFNTHIGDLGDLFVINRTGDGGIERTDDDPEHDLTLHAHLMVNLLKPSDRKFTINGALQPFNVKLLPILDAVTLKFAPAIFTSTDGAKPKFDVKVVTVEIGPALDFLQPLAQILSPGGQNGFFIHPKFSPPGIEAGFGIDLGTVSLGPVSFLNISIGASCELPFDDRPAHFRVSLSRRDSPFLMSVGIYGGGGFFSLIATAKGIVGFEAAFEFGGVAALHYGPLDAQGRITVGIYISKNELSAQIGGYFFAGGSARIAIFAISVALTVTIIQTIGGDMQGDATFSFTFSMGLCDFNYSVPVAHTTGKGFGGGGGGGGAGAFMIDQDGPAVELASAGPRVTEWSAQSKKSQQQPSPPKDARLTRKTKCMSSDWNVYRSYFDADL